MNTLRQTAQQALEALEKGETKLRWAAISALKQALAEPEQEPVAWMQEMPVSGNEERSVRMTTVKMVADEWDNPIPLYTAPAPRKPLTDEEIVDIWAGVSMDYDDEINIIELARAIERAHGIGEQT